MTRQNLSALKRECWTALLVLSLLFAQFAGFQHRIAHAEWQRDSKISSAHAGFDGGKMYPAHSCVALDAATLSAAMHAALPILLVLEASFALARHFIPSSWDAPILSHFLSRAPPAATL